MEGRVHTIQDSPIMVHMPSTLVDIDRLIMCEKPIQWLVQIYTYALSHCSWQDAVDSLPPITVTPADHYYIICDGHHRYECLKSLGAKHVKVVGQEE